MGSGSSTTSKNNNKNITSSPPQTMELSSRSSYNGDDDDNNNNDGESKTDIADDDVSSLALVPFHPSEIIQPSYGGYRNHSRSSRNDHNLQIVSYTGNQITAYADRHMTEYSVAAPSDYSPDYSSPTQTSSSSDNDALTTDPEIQSQQQKEQPSMQLKKKKRGRNQKQSFFSQFVLGCFSILFVIIVVGGLLIFFVLFSKTFHKTQGKVGGNGLLDHIKNNDNDESSDLTITAAPTFVYTGPPVSPIFPSSPSSHSEPTITPMPQNSNNSNDTKVPMFAGTSPPTSAPTTIGTVSASPSSATLPSVHPTIVVVESSMPPTMIPDTASPSQNPTPYPTMVPTPIPTTLVPTAAPVASTLVLLANYFQRNGITISDDTDSPENLAWRWLAQQDNNIMASDVPPYFDEGIIQRFAMATIKFALIPRGTTITTSTTTSRNGRTQTENVFDQPNRHIRHLQLYRYLNGNNNNNNNNDGDDWIIPGEHECTWPGVECSNGINNNLVVTKLHFGSLDLNGRIPPEISILTNLQMIDLSSNNDIHGTIPERFYDLTNLQQVYLYQNSLQGSISTRIGNLNQLTHFHVSHNQITGSIPITMRSTSSSTSGTTTTTTKQYSTIPTMLEWSQLYFLDLGRNQFTGTLPQDLGDTFVSLQHLHLNHNNFIGTIPEQYVNVGEGFLTEFSIEYNQFTGRMPGDHLYRDKLVSFTLHENEFTDRLDRDTCKLSIFDSGEMVEFKADCDICKCNGIFCQNCNE